MKCGGVEISGSISDVFGLYKEVTCHGQRLFIKSTSEELRRLVITISRKQLPTIDKISSGPSVF